MRKIKTYFILFINFLIYTFTAILMKLFPSKELYFRKLSAKLSVPTFIKEIEIVGNYDKDAKLILSNHQNMVDIPIIEYLVDKDLAWVAKYELGEMFLYGELLKKSDAILIKREDKKSLIDLLKATKDRLQKGKTIVIFPEGTRNKNPKKLLKFKAGAKLVAEKYNLKIQPILLLGIDEIISFHPLKINRGKLKVVFLPSIEPQKGSNWYEELREKMQKEIDKYYLN